MSPALIVELLVKFGPGAFELIRNLTTIMTKDTLTVQEVLAFLEKSEKTYQQYKEEEIARRKGNL